MELVVTRKNGDQHVVLYDDADADLLAAYTWCVQPSKQTHYAHARQRGTGATVRMHRLILPTAPLIDHINGNGLDNRRSNLRPATYLQNAGNMRTPRGSSRFKGVRWDATNRKWEAAIHHDRKRKWLGRFTDEVEAALAYDRAAFEKWGEFAYLNFPEVLTQNGVTA